MLTLKTVFGVVMLGLFVCLGTGCNAHEMGRFKIGLEARPDLKENITVDLVAVSESQFQAWNGMNMDDYANPNGFRDEARKQGRIRSFQIDTATRSFTILPTDPIYDAWKGIGGTPRLFVLTNENQNAVRPNPVGPGNMDFRRKVLPLENGAWPTKEIKIIFSPNGITLDKEPESKFAVK